MTNLPDRPCCDYRKSGLPFWEYLERLRRAGVNK